MSNRRFLTRKNGTIRQRGKVFPIRGKDVAYHEPTHYAQEVKHLPPPIKGVHPIKEGNGAAWYYNSSPSGKPIGVSPKEARFKTSLRYVNEAPPGWLVSTKDYAIHHSIGLKDKERGEASRARHREKRKSYEDALYHVRKDIDIYSHSIGRAPLFRGKKTAIIRGVTRDFEKYNYDLNV